MRVLMIAVWIFMVAATGYALFHVTFQVEALEGQLAELNEQIREEQETIHNLKAEWSYTSRPDWIQELGQEFMPEMTQMSPDQVLAIDDIPFRREEEEPFAPATSAAPATPHAAPPAAPLGTTEVVPASMVRISQ